MTTTAHAQSAPEPAPEYHPAVTLLDIWDRFFEAANAEPDQPLSATWTSVLRLDRPPTMAALYAAHADVVALVAQVRREVGATRGVPHQTILPKFPSVEAVVCEYNMARATRDVMQYNSGQVRDALQNAAVTLAHQAPQTHVSDDEIASLGDHIDALAQRVEDTPDLPPEVRTALLLCLERMRHALAHFHIVGPRAFAQAWKDSAGEIVAAGPAAIAELAPDSRTGFGSLMGHLHDLGIRGTPAGVLMLASHVNTLHDIGELAVKLTNLITGGS